ncbi:MAG: septum formation initiator family protein [Bacteroidia bacterium]|jgi:cell division protein DivIC|nr:septum formation initiator family protein [Bacteroidia bacterium]MCC6767799.1 septum formation initiator family protein [Bacteroidia bacterium]
MNFLRNFLEKYPIVKNRYVITTCGFIVWIVFFDQNNLIRQYEERAVLYQLRKEKKFYQEEIVSSKAQLNELLTDNQTLEKFAREKHLMKKDHEDIWLVIEEDKSKAASQENTGK